jgi:membrane protease YdiL (CAAX protease family)
VATEPELGPDPGVTTGSPLDAAVATTTTPPPVATTAAVVPVVPGVPVAEADDERPPFTRRSYGFWRVVKRWRGGGAQSWPAFLVRLVLRCLWDLRMFPLLVWYFLKRQWEILNREGAAERRAAGYADGPRFDPRVLIVLFVGAVSLVLQEYFGDRDTYGKLIDYLTAHAIKHWGEHAIWVRRLGIIRFGAYSELGNLVYWALARIVGYALLPAIAIWCLPGIRLRDCGLRLKGAAGHLWIYLVLYLLVLPLVITVSYQPGFMATYPFYRQSARSIAELGLWEIFYFGQFFALELFFRGILLHPLKRALGAYAIFVVAVPYCMIHFGKPMPETLGAIIAGIVLGTLSLRTRSIYAGVLIHISVAITMDLLAMSHAHSFPHHFWPHIPLPP